MLLPTHLKRCYINLASEIPSITEDSIKILYKKYWGGLSCALFKKKIRLNFLKNSLGRDIQEIHIKRVISTRQILNTPSLWILLIEDYFLYHPNSIGEPSSHSYQNQCWPLLFWFHSPFGIFMFLSAVHPQAVCSGLPRIPANVISHSSPE